MKKVSLALALLGVGLAVLAAPGGHMFVLDASNSMNDPWTGGVRRIEWAKEALIHAINAIPEETPFGVVAFGHRLPSEPKAASCADIELVLPYGVHNASERSALARKIQGISAKGWTPLAEALNVAASFSPAGTRLVLLSDGEETCGGDPSAVLDKLCAQGYMVDVVGIALEEEARAFLKALAEKCGGKFVLAADAAALPGLLITVVTKPAAEIPPCLAKYRVDPAIVALLREHLPYVPCSDPMWDVILAFLSANPPEKVMVGRDDDDALFGTSGNDLILGLPGADQLFGFGGNDLLIGGEGQDLVQGGEGCDLILGGPGNDLLFGGPADDTIYGEDGDDRIEGEAGNDQLFGGVGCDMILGGTGCNSIDGGPGQNFIAEEGPCPPCPTPCPPPARPSPLTPKPAPGQAPLCTVAPEKTVMEGDPILLRAEVSDPDGDVLKVTWSAPKGTFSDPHALETTYFAPLVESCEGEFVPLTVVAEDCCGGRSADTIVIHVLNKNSPPGVYAGPDLTLDEGQKVRLSGWACDPDGDAFFVTWLVPCERGVLDDPHSLTPEFTAPLTDKCEGEVVELILVVRDACGAEARDTLRIFVRNVNRAPWADAGPEVSVPECGQILLLGRAGDPDGDLIRVSWTVTAGKLLGADTLCPVFVAPEVEGCAPLKVSATLRVVDACGAVAEDQVVITVVNVNRPPTVKADP